MSPRIPGSIEQKLKLLENLSAQSFPYLVADILHTIYHHRYVKVLDGPGDGKRDITSISKEGKQTITQCKFTSNDDKTVSSRETDEIVIALNKYGVTSGIFATTGKLSPQAKREYIDQFSSFELNWIDGGDIVDMVLSNPLLKKIWFEGESITSIDTVVTYPLIIRNNTTRKNFDQTIIDKLTKGIEFGFSTGYDSYSTSQFFPYEASTDPVITGSLFCTTFTFSGSININFFEDIRLQIIQIIKQGLDWTESSSYSIKFGLPHYNNPDDKKFRNTVKFNLPFDPETYIVSSDTILTEYSWLADTGENWRHPSYIKSSNLRNYRLLNKKLDLSLEYVYICSPIDNSNNRNLPHIKLKKMLWQHSLFLTGDNESASAFLTSLGKEGLPDNCFDYGPSHKVLAWEHPSPVLFSLFISDEDDICEPGFREYKNKITGLSEKYNLQLIDSAKALSIARLNGFDPIPENPETAYGLVSFNEEFESIPSPFIYSKRDYFVEKVWNISTLDNANLNRDLDLFTEVFHKYEQESNANLIIDTETNKFVYIRVGKHLPFGPFESTQTILENQIPSVINFFTLIETELLNFFPKTRGCTQDYLRDELDIFYN